MEEAADRVRDDGVGVVGFVTSIRVFVSVFLKVIAYITAVVIGDLGVAAYSLLLKEYLVRVL
jgi:hypothetical protein